MKQMLPNTFRNDELDNVLISTTSPRPSPPFHGGEGDGSRGPVEFRASVALWKQLCSTQLPIVAKSGTLP